MDNAIYIFGCDCGGQGRPAKDIASRIGAKIYNTKRDSDRLKEQINFLIFAGINIKKYPAIVVENGGERITLLDQWKSLQV